MCINNKCWLWNAEGTYMAADDHDGLHVETAARREGES